MTTLYLPLKRIYFEQIRDGIKAWEYRRVNPYWTRRLVGRQYEHVEFTLGYPPKDDTDLRIRRPYLGYEIQHIQHEHFGADLVKVFAIRVPPT